MTIASKKRLIVVLLAKRFRLKPKFRKKSEILIGVKAKDKSPPKEEMRARVEDATESFLEFKEITKLPPQETPWRARVGMNLSYHVYEDLTSEIDTL